MKQSFTKALIVVLMIGLLAPVVPVSVPKAHAIDAEITLDIPRVAEAALHAAAVAAAQTAIQSITRSMVNWIRSGFHGSPAFETNLGVHLQAVADGAALGFLNGLQKDASVSSPFLSTAIGYVREGYLLSTSPGGLQARLRYSLNQVAQNDQAFIRGHFGQGGFDAWNATTFQCGNDPYCAQFAVQDELTRQITDAQNTLLSQLNWGQGFLSWPDPSCANSDTGATSLAKTDKSPKCKTLTPGQTISGQMTFLANEPELQLTVAQSIDQIIGALASQLISTVIGQSGLLGGSGGGGGGGTISSSLNQSGDSVLGSSLASNFVQAVSNQRSVVNIYQSDWQKIKDAATQASELCSLNGNSDKRDRATAVLNEANTALAKASSSLTILNGISADATRAQTLTGSAQSSLVQYVTDAYQCLTAGKTPTGNSSNFTCAPAATTPVVGAGDKCPVSPVILPSADELACIAKQSQDDPDTLLREMKDLASGLCH
jgi:hypothetical protein